MNRILQFLIFFSGTIIIILAYVHPGFRDAEGFIKGNFCLPISVSIALVLIGLCINSRLKRFSLFFALALTGQAVALQMIDAGTRIHYQHYKPLGSYITGVNILFLVFIVGQAALVIKGFSGKWKQIRDWVTCNFKKWQFVSIIVLLFFSSAAVSKDIFFYITELIIATLIQAINIGNIILAVWVLPDRSLSYLREKLEKIIGEPSKKKGNRPFIDRFIIVASLWVIVLSITLNVLSYERHPHIADEVGYLYHARYFADGKLSMPLPPDPEGFDIDLITFDKDKIFSPVPPGWPAMLSLGVLLGVPWMVNSVLGGVGMLLFYIFISDVYNRRTARIASLLLCFSPWYIFMSVNYLNQMFSFTCALSAAVATAWARNTGKAFWGWAGGIAIGMLSLTRPLEAVVVAALLGLWIMGAKGRRFRFSPFLCMVLGTIIISSINLPYNHLLTGSPTKFPLNDYFDKKYWPGSNDLGFGPDKGVGWGIDPFPGHGAVDAIINNSLNTFMVNVELFGWATGSLILIYIMLFSGTLQKKDYYMLSVIALITGIYIFYYFSGGPDFGARYWFLIIVPCVVLTVRGLQFISHSFKHRGETDLRENTRVLVAVILLCFLCLLNYFPWRAIDKYHHYRGMRPDIRKLAKEYNLGKSLILIRGNWFPDYASAVTYNPLNLEADGPVYAWDKNIEVRQRVLRHYLDRQVWIVNGPSITHGPFSVIKGPVSANELLKVESQDLMIDVAHNAG